MSFIQWFKGFKPKSVNLADYLRDNPEPPTGRDADPFPIVDMREVDNVKDLDPRKVSKHQWKKDD